MLKINKHTWLALATSRTPASSHGNVIHGLQSLRKPAIYPVSMALAMSRGTVIQIPTLKSLSLSAKLSIIHNTEVAMAVEPYVYAGVLHHS